MNYFALFDLPIGFKVDTNKLRAAFMDIQRASHPDKFAQSNSYEQDEALERSALANKGFSLLNNKDQLLPYVLELKGIISPDEKFALSPAFLMEMMELNEAWMEADDEASKQSILSQIKAIQDEILEPIKDFLEMDQIDTISQEALLQIKEYYYKKKYLDRILAEFR
jgi:molecular chaperone HscB